MKLLSLLACLCVAVNAGSYGGQKTSLEDIERDFTPGDKSSSYVQTSKTSNAQTSSPTKFGFVPQRTAASYAASKPKYQYTQTNYQVKKSTYKPQPSQYQQQYATQYSTPSKPQVSYQQQPTQQYALPATASQQYSTDSQQYLTPQQSQEYAYVQPESSQQYTIQYQQPPQQYEQYDNVQYVTDNSIGQPESKQYYTPQPQYYYVQQYPSPSTAVESVLDPKAFQYVMFVPSYASNSIPVDQKYQQQYTSSAAEPQLPPITTSVAKYTTVVPSKSSGAKYVSQKAIQYVAPSPKVQYQQQQQQQEEILIKREPKSLLDSYVPSIVQLQYLRQQQQQQGKSSYSKY